MYSYGGTSPYGYGGGFGGFSPIPQGAFQQFGGALQGIGQQAQTWLPVLQQQAQQYWQNQGQQALQAYQLAESLDPNATPERKRQRAAGLQDALSRNPLYRGFQIPTTAVETQPSNMGAAGAPPGGRPGGAWGTFGAPVTPPPQTTIPALPPSGGPYGGSWVPSLGPRSPQIPSMVPGTAGLPAPTNEARNLQAATGAAAQAIPPTVPPAATGGPPAPQGPPVPYQAPTTTQQIAVSTTAANTPLSDYLGQGVMDQLAAQGFKNLDRLTAGEARDVPGLPDAISTIQAMNALNPPGAQQAGQPAVAGLVPAQNIPTGQAAAGGPPGGLLTPIQPTTRTSPYTGPIRTKGDVVRSMGYSDEFASQYDRVPITNYQKKNRIDLDAAQKEIMGDANRALTTGAALARSDAALKEDARKRLVREAASALTQSMQGGQQIDYKDLGRRISEAGLQPGDVMGDAIRQANKDVLGTPVWVPGPNGPVPMTPERALAHQETVAHNKFTENMANKRLDLEERRFAARGQTPLVTINGVRYTFAQLKQARAFGAVTDDQIKAVLPNYDPPPPVDKVSPTDRAVWTQWFGVLRDPNTKHDDAVRAVEYINGVNRKYGMPEIPPPPPPEVDTSTTKRQDGGFLGWRDFLRGMGIDVGGGQQPPPAQAAPSPAPAQPAPGGVLRAPQGSVKVPAIQVPFPAPQWRNQRTKGTDGRWYWSDGTNWWKLPVNWQPPGGAVAPQDTEARWRTKPTRHPAEPNWQVPPYYGQQA